MGLSVIGAGFGRTGTMSIKLALEQLGFGPSHHMEEVFKNQGQLPHWQAAAAGDAVNWDVVFDGYASAVDWPSAHYWRQLADHYPAAKVVLSVRPAEKWWESYSRTIRKILADRASIEDPHARGTAEMANAITEQTFGGWVSKEACIAAFRRRTDDVVAAIQPDRLLVFDVAEGWEPLCGFLDCPVPDGDFPRTNSVEEFWQVFGTGEEPN